jgi:NCS2 family nucleobase:cation symporter-2
MRPAGLIYSVDETPPALRLLLLAVQYAVMIAIYLVLVVIVLRHTQVAAETQVRVIGMALVAAAIGAVLQGLPRGPVGSGFLAPPIYSAIYLGPSILAAEKGGLPLVFGMTIFAGLTEIAVGLVLDRLRLIFTQVITGLTVFLVGLQLGVVGIGEVLDVGDENLPNFYLHVTVSMTTLGIAVALSIWGRGQAKLLCSLIGLAAGLVGAAMIGLIKPDGIAILKSASWVALPWPHFGYEFDAGLAPAFLASGIAAAVRTVGVVTTCQRINDAGWRRPDMRNIRKGVLADGIACVIGGMLGAPGMNISPSLVGLSSATGATSRMIGFAAALVLLVIALSPKAAALFLMIPSEVAGAILVFTSSFMIASGMETILSRPMHTRAIYVVGVSTLLALSRIVFPDYFQNLPTFLESMTGSALAVGLGAAVLLRLVFLFGTRQKTEATWSIEDDAITTALEQLRKQAQLWKVDAETVDLCVQDAERIFERIRADEGGAREGRLAFVFDGVDFTLDISFAGEKGMALPLARRVLDFRREFLDNEEAAAHVGLLHFLHSTAADRKQVLHRRGRMIIRLRYAV